MALVASLSARELAVEPGGEATCDVTVANTGPRVESVGFEVLGPASGWATFEPPTVNLLLESGENEKTVRLRFAPPRTSLAPAGQMPFTVRVTSTENAEVGTVEDGSLVIGPFRQFESELSPRLTRGRWSSTTAIAITNTGNFADELHLRAEDDGDALKVRIRPPSMQVTPGATAFSKAKIHPKKHFWRGPDRTHAFTLTASTTDGFEHVERGSLTQQAVLPDWTGKALALLLAIIAALAAIWMLKVEPAIEAETKDQLAAAGITTTPEGEETSGTTPVGAANESVSFRLDPRASFTVPAGKQLELTDVVFENNDAQAGMVSLMRGEEVLLRMRLEDFRSLDFHFITPIRAEEGAPIRLVASGCRDIFGGTAECTATLFGSGTLGPLPS